MPKSLKRISVAGWAQSEMWVDPLWGGEEVARSTAHTCASERRSRYPCQSLNAPPVSIAATAKGYYCLTDHDGSVQSGAMTT